MKEYKFIYVRLGDCWQPWDDENDEKQDGGFSLNWAAEGIGFGELIFFNRKDGCECYTECMSKEFVKAALDHFFSSVKLTDK